MRDVQNKEECVTMCSLCMFYSNLLALKMLWTTKAFELSVDHDGNTAAQGFTLLHAEIKLKKKNKQTNNKSQTITEPAALSAQLLSNTTIRHGTLLT